MKPKYFLNLFFTMVLSNPCARSQADQEADVSQPSSLSNGIIDAHETIDSSILQTHFNAGIDPSSDILSTYFLRDYITAQVESFKYLGSEQESYIPWTLPLTSDCKKVEAPPKKFRYNIEKRKVPRYQYKYKYVHKTVYVREDGSSGNSGGARSNEGYDKERRSSAGKLVKRSVRSRELESVRQVGVKTEKVMVKHPEGKYEGTCASTCMQVTGLAVLPHGWHASNAQLVYTMIKAGLPATDPQIQLIIQSFSNLLMAYGIPDTTKDVAWLTALYANLPQDDPIIKEWTEKLVSRLVAGSAQVGDNPGMWGPVCINPKYLDEILDYDAKFAAKHITPLKNDLLMESRDRHKIKLTQELQVKEQLYEQWQKTYLTWAMIGTSAQNPRGQTIIPADTDAQQNLIFNYSLKVPGQAQDGLHFQFTDLESTCIALMALSEIHAAGILPKFTLAPTNERQKELAKPVDVQNQLASCYQTLNRLRRKTGGWDSCYSVKYHNTCREITFTSTLPRNLYDQIKSEDHWAYNVMGIAGMEYLARVIGGPTAQRIRKETSDYQLQLVQWLLEHTADLDIPGAPAKGDILYFLADMIGNRNPDAQFLRQQIGAMGLSRSEKLSMLDGLEGYHSHSARMALDAEGEYFRSDKVRPEDVGIEEAADPNKVQSMMLYRVKDLSERASFTYFIAKGVRQPVFAAVKSGSVNGTYPALDYFMNLKDGGIGLNYFYVSSANDLARYSTSLFLVMERGIDTALTDLEKENLTEYIRSNDGTVVLLGVHGKSVDSLEKDIVEMLHGAGLKFSVADGNSRGCRCVEFRVDERLVAMVLDASPDKEARETYSNRLKVYKSLIKEKLPENYLQHGYCLLPERVSNGELSLTGVEWNLGDGNDEP